MTGEGVYVCAGCGIDLTIPRLTIRCCCCAQLLSVAEDTVRVWAKTGELPTAKTAARVVLIPTVGLAKWCAEAGVGIPDALRALFAAAA